MKSLLGRLLRSFSSLGKENSFTEAVALLFETRPRLCLAWLKEEKLIDSLGTEEVARESADIVTQKWFAPLKNHGGKASQVDLFIRVHRILKENFGSGDAVPDVVMVESKIASKEGEGQLRRYAEHLARMPDVGSKTLVYITRGYDPKEAEKITDGLEGVSFKKLRWHDFYRFLQKVEKDSLTEEVMAFMEEEGMAGTSNFSLTDLMALSGMQRAFEILDETLDEEVKGELQSLAGRKIGKAWGGNQVQQIKLGNSCYIYADLTKDEGFGCFVGYQMGTSDGSPEAIVGLVWVNPGLIEKEIMFAAAKQISNRDGWGRIDQVEDDPEASVYEVRREKSLASFLQTNNHAAAVKEFFIDSIHQLKDELTAFKKEHPDLPWNGGESP